jgi:predicted RNase H-like nuclease (RuvC/YqgF family)
VLVLGKEKESVHDKRNDKKVWELEKQVRESKNRSETLKGEIERLSMLHSFGHVNVNLILGKFR